MNTCLHRRRRSPSSVAPDLSQQECRLSSQPALPRLAPAHLPLAGPGCLPSSSGAERGTLCTGWVKPVTERVGVSAGHSSLPAEAPGAPAQETQQTSPYSAPQASRFYKLKATPSSRERTPTGFAARSGEGPQHARGVPSRGVHRCDTRGADGSPSALREPETWKPTGRRRSTGLGQSDASC